MNQNKKLTLLECIAYTIFIVILLYSYKCEIIYHEVDNIARMIFPVIILLVLFIRYLHRDIVQLSFKEILLKWSMLILLSLLWVKTFYRVVLPINYVITTRHIVDAGARILQSFAILLVITELTKKTIIIPKQQKSPWYIILLYALPSLSWMVLVWLAVYPAFMMHDSTYIWTMVQGMSMFNDIHPITYTLFIKLLSLIWNSPACVVLFQILLSAFTIGFTGWTLQRIRVPKLFCWIAVIIISYLPVTWIYAVTIIKDSLFTMAMLILVDIIVLAVHNPKEILGSLKWYICAGVVGLFAMMARHNAILAVVGTLLIATVILLIKNKRSWCLRLGSTAIVVVITFYVIMGTIHISLGDNLKKQEASPLQYTQPIHQVMSIYAMHRDELDALTMKEIDRFINIDYVDSYIFGERSFGWKKGLYFQNVHKTGDWSEINHNSSAFFKLWFNLIKRYPVTAFTASQKLNSIVWYSGNWGFTAKYVSGVFQDKGYAIIKSDSKIPEFRDFLSKILSNIDNIWLLWRPAWAMVLCFVLAYIAVKRKGAKSLWIITPMVLNNAGLMIAVPFPDTRFVYLNFYTLIVFTLYTLLGDKQKSSE